MCNCVVCLVRRQPTFVTAPFGHCRNSMNTTLPCTVRWCSQTFWLHHVAQESTPLVHVSTSRRAEVVLFGTAPALQPPFSLLAGEFAFKSAEDSDSCTISRISLKHGTSRQQCSLQLEDILRTMAEQGCTYQEVVELLQQCASCRCLSCPISFDAMPPATSVFDLAKAGKAIHSGEPCDRVLAKLSQPRILQGKETEPRSTRSNAEKEDR